MTRTSTLSDIYRSMGINNNFNNPKALNNRNDQYDESEIDDYDEGEVSGYMVQKPLTTGNGINPYTANVS